MAILKPEWNSHLGGHPRHIIVHWTASPSGYKASDNDKVHYHFMVEHPAKVVLGFHSVADNDNTGDKKYAAHVSEFNTQSIGVSMCCMSQAQSNGNFGSFPLQQDQWEMMIELVAELCRHYKIPVTRANVLTHAEVTEVHGKDQGGKWDVATLPFDPQNRQVSHGSAKRVGDLMRARIAGKLSIQSENLPAANVIAGGKKLSAVLSNSASYTEVGPLFRALGWPEANVKSVEGGKFVVLLPDTERPVWLMRHQDRFLVSIKDLSKLVGGSLEWDQSNRTATFKVPVGATR